MQYGFNVVLTVHFVIFVIAILLSGLLGNRLGTYSLKDHPYLFGDKPDLEGIIWKSTVSFYLLYNSLFPLDLPVTLILMKLIYTYSVFENDV